MEGSVGLQCPYILIGAGESQDGHHERRETKNPRTFVVKKFFSSLRRILGIRGLYNRIDGTRLLAEAAVYALGHVNVVPRGSTGSVGPLLGLNRDRLGRTYLHDRQYSFKVS